MFLGTAPAVLAFYIRQLLVPFDYSLFYPVFPIATFGWRQTVEPLLLALAAALALLWLARQSRAFAFAALLLLIPLLPVFNLRAFSFNDFQHDRYLYLPSAGLCLLLALAVARFIRLPWLSLSLLAAACLALALVNLKTSSVWADDFSLFTHTAEVAPDNIVAAEYLGGALMNQQRFDAAIPLLKTALLGEGRLTLYENIAMCYLGLDDYQQASADLYKAMNVYPHAWAPHFYMGQVEMRQSHWPAAEAELRQAIRLRPEASPVLAKYHGSLAEVLEKEQNWTGAAAEFQLELQENPASEQARSGLRDLQDHINTR